MRSAGARKLQLAELPDRGLAQRVGAKGGEIDLQRHLGAANGNGGVVESRNRVPASRRRCPQPGRPGKPGPRSNTVAGVAGRESRIRGSTGSDADQRRAHARLAVAHAQAAHAELVRQQDLVELLQPRREVRGDRAAARFPHGQPAPGVFQAARRRWCSCRSVSARPRL